MRLSALSVSLLVALAFAACGPVEEAPSLVPDGTSTVPPVDAGWPTAEHPRPPDVNFLGGPTLKHPKVQPIMWSADPNTAWVPTFLTELTQTSYWPTVTQEYGVGALATRPLISRPDAIPQTFNDSAALAALTKYLGGTTPAWGTPDPETIYMFVIPPGTAVDQGDGSLCCQDFDGYHSEHTVGGTRIPYAIVCSCPGFDGASISDQQQLTIVTSHELVEAATDPYPGTAPAYSGTDVVAFSEVTGGETTDMCDPLRDAYLVPDGGTFLVSRSWSNASLGAGGDPCLPLPTPDAVYFGATPVLPDTVTVANPYYGPDSEPGVIIPLGQTKTIDVKVFSTAPLSAELTVKATDFTGSISGSATLQLTLDKAHAVNGDVLHLTIKNLRTSADYGRNFIKLETVYQGRSSLFYAAVGTH